MSDRNCAAMRQLFAGIGSAWGDDRAGWEVIAQLTARDPALNCVALRSPAELLDRLGNVDHLHVIDACQGTGAPGTISRFEWPSPDLQRVTFGGTHDFGLSETLHIAQQLAMLPRHVTIWGIEMAQDDGSTLRQSASGKVETRSVSEGQSRTEAAGFHDSFLSAARLSHKVAIAVEQLCRELAATT